MEMFPFNTFGKNFSEREQREIYGKFTERLKSKFAPESKESLSTAAESAKAAREKAAATAARLGSGADEIFGGRAFGNEIDPKHAIGATELRIMNAKNKASSDPTVVAALTDLEKLAGKFAGSSNGAVHGVVLGLSTKTIDVPTYSDPFGSSPSTEKKTIEVITIEDGDPAIIKQLLANVEYFKNNPDAEKKNRRVRFETESERRSRMYGSTIPDPDAGVDKDRKWDMIEDALLSYESKFEEHRSFYEAAMNDPIGALSGDIPEGFAVKYPKAFKHFLIEAANLGDPTTPEFAGLVLNLEKRMGKPAFLQLIDEVAAVQPKVLQVFDEKMLRDERAIAFTDKEGNPVEMSTAEFFRTKMIAAVALDPMMLVEAEKVYDTFWSKHPEAYEKVISSYVGTDPDRMKEVTVRFADFFKENPEQFKTFVTETAVAVIGEDTDLMEDAITRFADVWKENPDLYKTFITKTVIAVPSFFFKEDLWRKEDLFPTAESVNEMVKAILADRESSFKLIQAISTPAQLDAFDEFDIGATHARGYLGFVEFVLFGEDGYEEPDPADPFAGRNSTPDFEGLIVVSRNAFLFNTIQDEDNDLYKIMTDTISKVDNAEMRKLLRDLDYISEDEDVAMKLLDEAVKKIDMGNPGWERRAQRQFDLLESIPPHVMFSSDAREDIFKLFEARGEMFKDAPESWKKDPAIVRTVVRNNADAYVYVDPSLRGVDATKLGVSMELLREAMKAEAAGKGNMHWENIGDGLKAFLAVSGVTGMPSLREMFDLVYRGGLTVDKLEPDDVDSPLDDEDLVAIGDSAVTADPADRDRLLDEYKTLAASKLLEHVVDHPEYIVDLHDTVRADSSFIAGLLDKPDGDKFFPHLDHTELSTISSSTPGMEDVYKDLIRDTLKKDAKYFAYVDIVTQKDVEFIIDVYGDDSVKMAQAFSVITPSLRGNSEFLLKFVNGMEDKWTPVQIVNFIQGSILPDPIHTGRNTIENFLTEDNAKVLKLLIKNDKRFYKDPRIPKDLLTAKVVKGIINAMEGYGHSHPDMVDLLTYVGPDIAKEYYKKNTLSVIKRFYKDDPNFFTTHAGFHPFMLQKPGVLQDAFAYLADEGVPHVRRMDLLEFVVPKSTINLNVLTEVMQKMVSIGATAAEKKELLRYVDADVRADYVLANPNEIAELFRTNPRALARMFGEVKISKPTLNTIKFVVINDAELFNNILRSNLSLWFQMGPAEQAQYAAGPGIEADVAALIRTKEAEIRRELAIETKSKSLNKLRVLRQRVDFYEQMIDFRTMNFDPGPPVVTFKKAYNRMNRQANTTLAAPFNAVSINRLEIRYDQFMNKLLAAMDIGMLNPAVLAGGVFPNAVDATGIDARYLSSNIHNQVLVEMHFIESSFAAAPRAAAQQAIADKNVQEFLKRIDQQTEVLYTTFNGLADGTPAKLQAAGELNVLANNLRDSWIPYKNEFDAVTIGKFTTYIADTGEYLTEYDI